MHLWASSLWHALALTIYVVTFMATHVGAAAAQVVQYTFDKARAGGVVGNIHVTYNTPHSPTVSITTDIDMSALNMTKVLALHPECEPRIHEFQWYLVVNEVGVVPLVGFLDKCNIMDKQPLRDEDSLTDESADSLCLESSPSSCADSVNSALKPPSPRQSIHLSQHLGRLVVQPDGRISQSWQNVPFPAYGLVTPRWSIVLHAVCGDTSPPVVCARVNFELSASNSHIQSKEAHSIVGVAAFVLASSLLLFLT
ncbi:hypothetical protein H310_04650 [Aphanomyces invadans]|uniref:Uncharacterized protein n=1 Tax=Aphanomyces invadans TaxID=157072 RepID=A0A024UEQ7_9STRA|nr:hypothetical protein H310_04650 [Aphanomyces invadans]ETW04357.1 hypothetical protein H310_04650 [Aphanomyces invadans]|eukprot:XP_008867313.1 hypothetical protein H310_04650 [Aphanomyces invadans]